MVTMQRQSLMQRRASRYSCYACAALAMMVVIILLMSLSTNSHNDDENLPEQQDRRPLVVSIQDVENVDKKEDEEEESCVYEHMSDLTDAERYPKRGTRHMVQPPQGGLVALVCCQTTEGPWSIVVREQWAPLGARRFLEMVQGNYFDAAGVPLMRCMRNFLCQFGLSNKASISKEFRQTIPDDPNWLPEGPDHRRNEKGVARFAKGYLAYAGGGKNSRSNQFIVSLTDVETLAGGSPWEVPWGELVGAHSFETLDAIYTGYGDNGPPQGELMREGMTVKLLKQFSEIDFVKSCRIMDREVQAGGEKHDY